MTNYSFKRGVIVDISTHTLTWSVTFEFFDNEMYIPNFNSHAHVERDESICNFCKILYISTHTLTWSVTMIAKMPQIILIISTHTLTWSVTIAVLRLVLITKISTHTLTWSVTHIHSRYHVTIKFQLTRSRGA